MARAVLFAVLAALLYAVSAPLSKLLLAHAGATMLAALLYLGAGLGLALSRTLLRLRRTPARAEGFTRRDMPFVAGMVALDVAAPILLLTGLRHATAANVSLLNNFEIVATSLIARTFFGERISRRLWWGISLVTLACALLSVEGGASFSFSVGSLCVLLACVCWGLENNCTRRLSAGDPIRVTVVKGLGSGTGSLTIALAVGETLPSLGTVAAALALGFLAYGLSIAFYIRAQREIGAARTSAYYALAPFMGAGLSFLLFADVPSVLFFVALLVMAAGTVLVTKDALRG